ncbi:Aste57867_20631 [Aphanomyces stellatus]|uniref:Aste57867_20631 protein n=1 Tax=Aphanomyces stellatus TaxID=120398 RepID=A0A485LGV2_9STRA|nr:hypothetical protein As57867_020563 [Aphanomyces stellatus]VFT97311.1 Aste57867_20631 [Aphanomyces stellatus]
MQRPLSRANSARASLSSNAGPGLANYSKLSISMTYKNRQSTVFDDAGNNNSFLRESAQLDEKSRMTTVSTASVASTYCSSRDSSISVQVPLPRPLEKQISAASPTINTISEDSDVSEVEIAAMQAKRALRRMCLSLVSMNQSGDENVLMDDSDDDDDEHDDDGDHSEEDDNLSTGGIKFPLRYSDEDDEPTPVPAKAGKPKQRLGSDLLTISRADLRQLQSRLKFLEEKLVVQAEKQADLEMNLEREVRARTKKLEAEYEEKIEELTMARDFDVDQEIQRRLSDFSAASADEKAGRRSKSQKRKGLFRASSNVVDLFRGSISNSHTTAHTSSSDLDQFKDFLLHNSKRMSDRLSRSTTLRDTYRDTTMSRDLYDDEMMIMHHPHHHPHMQADLVETLHKLRSVVHDQDDQLEQAKYLISVAVVKMNATEVVVKDAFDELGKMDARCERQAIELAELRRYSSASSLSASFGTNGSFVNNHSFLSAAAPPTRASGRPASSSALRTPTHGTSSQL